MVFYHSNNKRLISWARWCVPTAPRRQKEDDQRFNRESEAGLGYRKHWLFVYSFHEGLRAAEQGLMWTSRPRRMLHKPEHPSELRNKDG